MSNFTKVVLVFLCSMLLGAIAMRLKAQTTQLSFTTVAGDLNRPGAGANEWSYGQNIINIPTQGVNTPRLDRYWRFTWLDFQPAGGSAGVYSFTTFDAKIQESISKGQKFSFGIMQQCTSCDANLQNKTAVGGKSNLLPTWLITAMPSSYAYGNDWFPDYNSSAYLNALRNLSVAINAHILAGSFNGVRYRDVIDFVDIRGYGNYGEWTNNDFHGPVPTVASLDSMISYQLQAFNTFQCVNMIGAFDGGQLPNVDVPPAVGYYALMASNSVGKLGWRRDNWGWTDSYISSYLENNNTTFGGITFKDSIMARYKYAPIVGEPADGENNFETFVAQVQLYHGSSFGNGNFNNAINATIQNNFRAASAAAGYRILIDTGSMTTTPAAGGVCNVTLKLKNTNGTPPYVSWKIVYEWWNGTTLFQRDTASDLKGFLSTTDVAYSTNITLRTVPAGSGYSLHVKVVDPLGYAIPMPLFNTGRMADGSYLVRGSITVSSGTGGGGGTPTPVANAGASQAITLPTSSVTLSGSGSTGTIATYTWSQVSGPNTATIATPATVSTTVSGMIAGLYVFQLALDGGSSDTLQVVVSPAVVPPPLPSGVNIFTTQAPNAGTLNDGPQGGITGIEFGVKFRTTVAGYITGVRFYKKQDTTTGHKGELYNSAGTRLAQATFTNESTNGWQTVQFVPAILITANTTYIAAIFSPSGNYISNNNYFTTGISNLPVTGLADGTDGNNGLYKYTATPAFPNATFQKANYWVDPYFTANVPGTIPGRLSGGTIYFIQR